MKLHTDDEFVIGNTKNNQTFQISAGAKAFKVLSSNIYKNKIRAIVRELACNAVDAHVLNGQTKPYTIKCPNNLDQTFVVRDFGPGLNHEDMIELYTTYFASNKADRNDQIGAFGLGSKSPFSYTNTFSVKSFHEGVVRVYQCMLSNGEPQVSKTFETKMSETDLTGIEVTVPVKTQDIPSWEKEIEYVFRPFKTGTYEITGAMLDVQAFDQMPSYSNSHFVAKTMYGLAVNLYAIYGNIVYPLDDVPNLKREWLLSQSRPILIHFDMGELDIQPSREQLSLDEITIANIQKRVEDMDKKAREEELNFINSITSEREAKRMLMGLEESKKTILKNEGTKFFGKTWNELFSPRSYEKINTLMRESSSYVYESYFGKICLRRPILAKQAYKRVKVSEVLMSSFLGFTKKKLFLVVHDDKSNIRKTIHGLFLSKDENTPNIMDDHVMTILNGVARQDEFMDELKSIMGDDEIVVFKTSECEQYRELIPGYGVKKPKIEGGVRPKSPNGIEYTLVPDGSFYSMKELYMNAKEISEIQGFVYGQYRDDLMVLGDDKGFHTILNMSPHDLRRKAAKMGIKKITMVRPSIFTKVVKLDDVHDVFEHAVVNPYIELFNSIPSEGNVSIPDGKFGCHFKSNEKLHVVLHPFFENVHPQSNLLNDKSDNLKPVRAIGRKYKPLDEVEKMIKIWDERRIKSLELFQKAKDEFVENHPFFAYMMNDRYTIDDELIETLIKQFKILESA